MYRFPYVIYGADAPHQSSTRSAKESRSICAWCMHMACSHGQRTYTLELDLFSMLCSHEIFTDQSHHAWIRSEKNPSIGSDACMTADYARGQPAMSWTWRGGARHLGWVYLPRYRGAGACRMADGLPDGHVGQLRWPCRSPLPGLRQQGGRNRLPAGMPCAGFNIGSLTKFNSGA